MFVAISGLIGRAPQSLNTPSGAPVVEAALAVTTSERKDWYALQFSDALIEASYSVRKGDTISVTGELTFEPLADGGSKPVITVSDLQLCNAPIPY
jgi:single-stranded DNA-binding protein